LNITSRIYCGRIFGETNKTIIFTLTDKIIQELEGYARKFARKKEDKFFVYFSFVKKIKNLFYFIF